MPQDQTDQRESVGYDLLRAAARLTRWATRHASFDVPYAQARLLALVEDLGPARVSALAEADHSSQPAMTTGLQRLEAQGFVTRTADPLDARASLVALTPSGQSTLDRVRAARVDVLAPALDSLDDDGITRLRNAISVMEGLVGSTTPVGNEPQPEES